MTSVCCERLGEVDELHAEAEVGLVGAEAVPGLGPRDALDRRGPLPRGGLGRIEDGFGDEGHHVVLAGEGALHVELHELELAVGPQVLVAQAAGDLEVAVEAAHHEELLGQLRALGQRVEGAVVQAGRDRELPGALGRGRPQQRRLDLREALAVHGGPQRRVDPGAEPQVALHTRPAQVDVAVAQPHRLVGLVAVVDGERRGLRLVEDLDGAVPDLHLTGADAGVDGALGAVADGAGDGDDPLGAHVGGVVDHALDDAGVVAQVDEGEVLAVLAPAGHPAAQADGGADVGRAQHAAQVRAHGGRPVRLVVCGGGHGVSRVRVGVVGVAPMGVEVPVDVVVRPLGERRVGEEALELVNNGSPGHGPLVLARCAGGAARRFPRRPPGRRRSARPALRSGRPT